jgi:glutaredoxin
MAWASIRIALASGLIAAFATTGATAQTQQVYRYVDKDGHVVYSDRVPPGDSKDIQSKRLRGNVIENNDLPLAAQQAQERFPVTLYTFACGEVCTASEGLLNKRGVPFTTVNVETPDGAAQLSKNTGELRAPVLQVGDKTFVKGFSEAQWQAALDVAGYPKTQTPRRTAATRVTAPEPPAPAPDVNEPPKTVAAPGSYPKQ